MAGFDNDILYAENVDFTGGSPVTGKVTTNGQLLIGSTVAPNIRVGSLISSDSTIDITVGAGTINIESVNSKTTTYNPSDSPATWTKDARTKYVKLYMWGGGGGGGSGRRGLTTAAGGGGGGANGGFVYYEGPASAFNSSESVTIGAGGTGGAAQTANSTNGNVGGVNTFSTFGNLTTNIADVGATAAVGGTITSAAGGTKVDGVNLWTGANNVTASNSGAGGNVTGGSVSAVNITNPVSYLSTCGGGGSGADSVIARQAGSGGTIQKLDAATTLAAGGAGGIETGTINGSNGTDSLTTGGVMTGGTGGGGGGGQKSGGSAGTGGNGGVPGGGGGGGGGSLNGTNSGAGGNGGNGRVIIIELF